MPMRRIRRCCQPRRRGPRSFLERRHGLLGIAKIPTAARVQRRISEEERYMERGVTARRTRNMRRVAALSSLRQEQSALRRAHQADARIGLEGGASRSNLVIQTEGITKA